MEGVLCCCCAVFLGEDLLDDPQEFQELFISNLNDLIRSALFTPTYLLTYFLTYLLTYLLIQ